MPFITCSKQELKVSGLVAADPQQMLQGHCIYLQSGNRVLAGSVVFCCSGVFGHTVTPWLHVTQLWQA